MWADMHMATGVSAIVKKSLLLFVTTAAGSLCFAAPSALGQNWTLTSAPFNSWSDVVERPLHKPPERPVYLVNRVLNQRNGLCTI